MTFSTCLLFLVELVN